MAIKFRHILSVTTAAILLSAVFSCSVRRDAQVRQVLAAADSLMMTEPQAALDTLMTIDSSDAAGLPRADRAFYTMLRTEAEYKCWQPVAENTAIAEAVDYYRRKGPEDRLARALVMQGTVLFERGDTEGAMAAYKEAEPMVEREGDLEQLGLLHTRIGELYQTSAVNDSAALARYCRALECFEKAKHHDHQMTTCLSIAKMLFVLDSADNNAIPYLEKGLSMAEAEHDTLSMLSAYSLYAFKEQNTANLVKLVKKAEQLYDGIPAPGPMETDILNSIYYCCAELFINSDKPDSARMFLNCIRMRDEVDSLGYYTVMADFYEREDNTKKATEYLRTANDMTLRILKEGYDSRLVEIEKKYDNDLLSERLKLARNRILALSALLLLAVAVSFIIYFAAKNRAGKRELALRDAVNDLQSLRAGLLSKQSEAEQLQSVIHENETALSDLKKQIETEADRHDHEAKEIKSLRESLISQISSNRELLSVNGEMLGMAKALADICYVYEGSPNMPGKVEELIKSTLSDESISDRIQKMFELAYPGFMDSLSKEYPSLNDGDRKLTALVCCGFTPNTASIIMGSSVQNLNARKYRLARKMGIEGRISTFLKKRLSEYITFRQVNTLRINTLQQS